MGWAHVAAALPPELLARICAFLPPGDAALTAPRVSKAMAAAAAPRVAGLRAEVTAMAVQEAFEMQLGSFGFRVDPFSIPLWALHEAWPRLGQRRRARAAAHAAFHGDLATLRWALPRLLVERCGHAICPAAAAGGQLAALQCARALGWPWDCACSAAARRGHLAVLQWARAQQPPCPWDEETCALAAAGGHLAVLQWARAQQPPCPWDEGTCRAAAQSGHLAVLQWARAQQPPCPWVVGVCSRLANSNILVWISVQEARDRARL